MIGASNTQGQKYWVDIVQWAPETSVSEKIADIFLDYNIGKHTLDINPPGAGVGIFRGKSQIP